MFAIRYTNFSSTKNSLNINGYFMERNSVVAEHRQIGRCYLKIRKIHIAMA